MSKVNSTIGEKIIRCQNNLSEHYHYEPIIQPLCQFIMKGYIDNIPDMFRNTVEKANHGYSIMGKDISIRSIDGILISNKYDRIVIGHYGAFIEISNEDVVKNNIKAKEGQEYRYKDPNYKDKVKYYWATTKDDTDCKLYFQRRPVKYADYIPNKWYISPYEVMILDP